MGDSIRMQVTLIARYVFTGVVAISPMLLGACSLMSSERTVVDRQGLLVAVERDPTIRRASTPVTNAHPANLSQEELRTLLTSLQVSGWSGTVVGLIEQPRPIPVFTDAQLRTLVPALLDGFRQAGPNERVTFALPPDTQSHAAEQTKGALFFRDRYLHVVLMDHTAFTRADTGGMEERDPRDTKGMKLWITGPTLYTVVPDQNEPRWDPFERVHLSLAVQDLLAFKRTGTTAPPLASPPSIPTGPGAEASPPQTKSPTPPSDALQEQIQRLTTTNDALRSRLDDQQKAMQSLQDELSSLRQLLPKPPSKANPTRK